MRKPRNRLDTKAELERQIEAAKHQVRRNLPAWPSSFGPFANECGRGKGGRRSGICLDCAMDDLAILIGKEAAVDGRQSIRRAFTPRELKNLVRSATDAPFEIDVSPFLSRQIVDVRYR